MFVEAYVTAYIAVSSPNSYKLFVQSTYTFWYVDLPDVTAFYGTLLILLHFSGISYKIDEFSYLTSFCGVMVSMLALQLRGFEFDHLFRQKIKQFLNFKY